MNGYQRIARIARPKQIKYFKEIGRISKCSGETCWILYKKYVWFLTLRNKKKLNKPKDIEDVIKYSLDHKFSICSGFNNNVSPFVISSLHNLEYIDYTDNLSKQANNSINLKKLYELCGYTINKSKYEYNIIIDVINEFINNNEFQSMLDINNKAMELLNETKFG